MLFELAIMAVSIVGSGVSAYVGVRVGMMRIEGKADAANAQAQVAMNTATRANERIDEMLLNGSRTIPLRR